MAEVEAEPLLEDQVEDQEKVCIRIYHRIKKKISAKDQNLKLMY